MGRGAIQTRSDWVEILEAVYAPIADDEVWAQRLTSFGPSIFGSAALFGIAALEHTADCASARVVLSLGVPAGMHDMAAAFDEFGPLFVRAFFYPPSIVSTHVEISTRLPPYAADYMAMFRKKWGVADGLGLCVNPLPGTPLVLFGGFDRTVTLMRNERKLLSQIALHVETGWRLRRRPKEVVTAVIAADGKVLHREDGAPDTSSLAKHVAAIERARAPRARKEASAIDLWATLVEGRTTLVPRVEGTRRHYLVVENAPATQPIRALTRGELDTLSCATRGLSGKLIAYTLGISEASVSARLARAAMKIGTATRLELVRIAAMLTRDPRARFESFVLTTAESDVLQLLSNGLSNREIASIRNRSVRTIANQVATILRKTTAPTRRTLAALT